METRLWTYSALSLGSRPWLTNVQALSIIMSHHKRGEKPELLKNHCWGHPVQSLWNAEDLPRWTKCVAAFEGGWHSFCVLCHFCCFRQNCNFNPFSIMLAMTIDHVSCLCSSLFSLESFYLHSFKWTEDCTSDSDSCNIKIINNIKICPSTSILHPFLSIFCR